MWVLLFWTTFLNTFFKVKYFYKYRLFIQNIITFLGVTPHDILQTGKKSDNLIIYIKKNNNKKKKLKYVVNFP